MPISERYGVTMPETKRCNDCGETLSLDYFDTRMNRQGDKVYGPYIKSECKTCSKRRHKRWRDANPVKMKAWTRKGRMARYGLTSEDFALLSSYQGEVCAICHLPNTREFLVVDHDHLSGAVRGLLCDSCNLGLGKFKDDPRLLEAASSYLRRVA